LPRCGSGFWFNAFANSRLIERRLRMRIGERFVLPLIQHGPARTIIRRYRTPALTLLATLYALLVSSRGLRACRAILVSIAC
jgi:hypothetical protein